MNKKKKNIRQLNGTLVGIYLIVYFAQLLILHPPYDDIIKFSDKPDDLSNAASTADFLDMFQAVAQNGFDLLEPGRFAAVIIGDKYANGELVPLGFQCMDRMQQVGATNITLYPQCMGEPFAVFEEQLARLAEDVLPLVEKQLS